MYAVVRTGGKQYRVQEGDLLEVELLDAPPGAAVTLDDVLLVVDGERAHVGRPRVEGATVTARVVRHFRGPKIVVFKYKRRKNYRRKQGHRQELTLLRIEGIQLGGAEAAATPPPPPPAAAVEG